MPRPDPAPTLESLLTHSEWIATLARRLLVDRASADDLVQDTWVAALRNPPRETHSLRAWLSTVVRRLARAGDPLRNARRELAFARDDSPPTDDVVAQIEQERLLAKFVVELEDPYRSVVLKRFYGGLSSAQIARSEDVPEATVRTRVRRALAMLRERLEQNNGSDPREWPLASIVLARERVALHTLDKGVLLMSTKTTLALGIASGALCTLAVTEGILPRFSGKTEAAAASITEAREAGGHASPSAADRALKAKAAQRDSSSADPLDERWGSGRTRAPKLSTDDLSKMLRSSERLDQIRAIELLREDDSPAANQVLLDTFLASKDSVLVALLNEAMLKAPLTFEPGVMNAFLASDDAQMLARLSGLLTGFVKAKPELEHEVVGHLLGALEESEAFPDRAGAATGGLVALGVGAIDDLTKYLVDPDSGPKGVGSAVWAIAQLPGEHGELVREKLAAGLQAVDEPAGRELTETEKAVLLEKTGSIAWAASLRPVEEHDRLSEVLLASLLRTRDPAQAGTLAWSLGNLKGISDGSRVGLSRQLFDALNNQKDAGLRQQYAHMLQKLAVDQPIGPNFNELLQLAQDQRNLQAKNIELMPLLDKLLAELHAYEMSAGK